MSDLPSSPFKGLAAFGDSAVDALLFFGRGREREAIVANLRASRLTVLYGPSGVGKSSLLRAGVAQHLRALGDGVVIVHDAWAEDPVSGVIAAAHEADPELGPTAGLVDTVAAAAQRNGGAYLLLDQFEEYFLYHGSDGALAEALPELLRRPGLRVNVLIALRDDALAELDAFTDSIPEVFANLLRLDRLDRRSARSAVVGPLERYSELAGVEYRVEPALVDELLDEVAVGRVDLGGGTGAPDSSEHVEAPLLQLVLERLWSEEASAGSRELRLETFRRLGGAEPIVRDHVHGTLEGLPAEEQDAVARIVRQLVTPSGAKTAHTAADLSDYAAVAGTQLQSLLELLVRERIVRAVEGSAGGPARYEIFHDVLAEPLLAWRAGYALELERDAARRQRRRLLSLVGAALVALAVVGAIAVFAITQRSAARAQARQAHAHELAAQALAGINSNPALSLSRAVRAAEISPEAQTESVLRSTLLAMREQHVVRVGGNVVAASFAPSGGRLLVASSDGAAGIYDESGVRLVALPRQHALTRAAWSADGRLFATGDAGGTVTVWRASDGRRILRVETPAPIVTLAFTGKALLIGSGGHLRILSDARGPIRNIRIDGAVVAAALSPDGRLLAVAAKRGGRITARILDAHSGRLKERLAERAIGSMGFSADGRLLVTGSADKTARLWNASTGRQLHVLRQRGHVLAEHFSPNGRLLVTASSDGTAAVWAVGTGERILLLTGATGIAEDASFSPDGKEIVVAFGDRLARIYNSEDGRLLAPLAGHGDAVTSVAYDPSGRTIVTASADGTARLWSANAGDELLAIDHRRESVQALFAGERVLSGAGQELRVLSPGGKVLARVPTAAPITAVAASGTSYALADSAGNLERATIPAPAQTTGGLGVTALAYAADGTLVTGSRDGTIRIWGPRDPLPRVVHAPGAIVAISAVDTRFVTRTADGSVRIYGVGGELQHTLGVRVQEATLAPNGSVVATTNAREADLWDAATGKLVHRLVGHRSRVADAEFSPDGRLLVTASDDHDARTWDVATGRLLHVLRGHFFPVRSASFSPDGRWVVTASQFTAGLWDAATGQLVLYLQGNTRPLTGALFSPTGDWILTGSEDGTARIVQCDICRNLAGLEQLAHRRLRSIGTR